MRLIFMQSHKLLLMLASCMEAIRVKAFNVPKKVFNIFLLLRYFAITVL